MSGLDRDKGTIGLRHDRRYKRCTVPGVVVIAIAAAVVIPAVVAVLGQRLHEMFERIVRDGRSLLDASDLVKCPVNSQINAALAVFLRGVAEMLEGAGDHRSNVAVHILV